MSLDQKLKQAALNVALRHMTRSKAYGKERTCRNVIELGKELATKEINPAYGNSLYAELYEEIEGMDLETLRCWMIEKFEL
ncbi:MAG: hypothetical protein ACRCW2_07020 [Cellulosilyticaceae bacterium]